jgi:DNA-binding transcriptional MerR regulator
MDEKEVTLDELSARSGVEPRTLRSWVSEGLLLPPSRSGRGATYPQENLARALAIRALKDIHGLALAKIGRLFLTASHQQIRDWARQAGNLPQGSARDYLRGLRRAGVAEASVGEDPDWQGARPMSMSRRRARSPSSPEGSAGLAELGRIEKLIVLLQSLLAEPAPRRAQGMVWTRIEITPDLEIAVRGELAPSERHLFLQLADQLRALLNERTLP